MVNYGAAELATQFLIVRKNTIQVADEIPEDKYTYSPVPGWRTVSELLRHIAWSHMGIEDMHVTKRLATLKGYDFGVIGAKRMEKERQQLNKSQILALLKNQGDTVAGWLRTLDSKFLNEVFTDVQGMNPKTRFEGMLAIKEHEMHHRAQLMLIQRMLGIVPHLTREREERNRQRAAAAAMAAKH